jgi:hypothetical protein
MVVGVKTQLNNGNPGLPQTGPKNNDTFSDHRLLPGLVNEQSNGVNSINIKPHVNHHGPVYQEGTENDYRYFPSQGALHAQDDDFAVESINPCPALNACDQRANSIHSNNSSSSVTHDVNEDSLMVKSLIKDPQATRELRNRLQGIALKQRNIAAMRADSSTNVDRKTAKGQKEGKPVLLCLLYTLA